LGDWKTIKGSHLQHVGSWVSFGVRAFSKIAGILWGGMNKIGFARKVRSGDNGRSSGDGGVGSGEVTAASDENREAVLKKGVH